MPRTPENFDSLPRAEILRELAKATEAHASLLLPVDKCWQPSDLLPDMASEAWLDQLTEFRRVARHLPDDLLVTLVANMITEEALPSYHAWLCNLEDGFDKSGIGSNGIANWIRGWVAEEKRHGDVLARYLFATGRVDMRKVEQTVHHLLRNGFDPLTDNNIFQGFIYTSFQERATFISHSGVGRLAKQYGDHNLARICDHVAGDEVRHERAYERFVGFLFEIAPNECMLSLEKMLRSTIIMPSRRMTDGVDEDIFTLFSSITQRNGIYTTSDYAQIMDHLVRLWKIEKVGVTSPAAKQAQDFASGLPARYLKLAQRAEARLAKFTPRPISWLFQRVVAN